MNTEANRTLTTALVVSLENEKRLKDAEILAKLGHWELDLVNNVLVWSDEIYRIFDTTPQSFGATYEAFLDFIHPEDRDLVNEAYTASVENKQPYGPITHRLILKDGSVKFVEERGMTDYDENGNPIRSLGIVQDITERVLNEKIKAELKEKEVLLKEIYHRVKNNLQLVSSFISIQSLQIQDEKMKEMCETVQNRIQSVSLIHEQLCRSSNLANINIREYVGDLVSYISQSVLIDQVVNFELNVDDVTISMDKAVPTGLILNEVISNSVKYAFNDEDGTIKIDITRRDNEWCMNLSDNGKGVINVNELTKPNSFGVEIIRALTEQLDGQIEISGSPGKGVAYTITFP